MAKPFRTQGLVRQLCTYCGSVPSQKIRWHNKKQKVEKSLHYTGIDRKNNAKGYVNGNVVSCCGVCNSIKGKHLTHREMLAVMKIVRVLRETRKA